MEKIVEQGLLYDFYGELLTKHQQSVYKDVVFNDLSLNQRLILCLAEFFRQPMNLSYFFLGFLEFGNQSKLFLITKEKVTEIHRLTEEFSQTQNQALIEANGRISNEILDL